jgi:short-subunit dehydrogenase
VRRELKGSVVVVVGASSGVGRTAAELFADRGAHLVIAARSPEPLRDLAASLRGRGVKVLTVPTDIGDPTAAAFLARRAVEEFGRIDTWVNTASVLLAGPFGSETEEEVERIVRTNVLGQVWGARAALAQFRQQESGVLIDVSSMLGVVPNPLVPVYTMTKFAIRGLSLSLHHLSSTMPGVRVCVILPGPIDTPMFDRAANHTGRDLRAIPPALAPERVAGAIVSCARRPRRQVKVGLAAKTIGLGDRVVPGFTEWFVARAAATMLTRSTPVEPTSGNVHDVAREGHRHGGYRLSSLRRRAGRAFGRGVAASGA